MMATSSARRNAYAYIEIEGCDAQQTKTISGTLNPEWNETFTFKIKNPMSKGLKIKVYDKDLGRDDVLGELDWDLCKLKMGNGPKDLEKTIDMNWMGMCKGATLHLTVHNKGGWGEFNG